MSSNREFILITPAEAAKKDFYRDGSTEAFYKKLLKNNRKCHCGQSVWRLGRTGMCFECTTGQTDRSEDFELTE